LEVERVALVAELRRAAGLAGRTRAFSDEAERARVNVTRPSARRWTGSWLPTRKPAAT